ncbi:MAG: HAMP domain-containing protein [Bacteroidales bacterium]|nr:HAMP domain-containing protein [Bacteroidales bacterium]
MMLNQDTMYEQSSAIKEKSKRAIMPGIVSIIAAIVFSFMLNFYITRNFIAPISKITEAVSETYKGDNQLDTSVKARGELKKLEKAINQMIRRLNQ